MDNHIIIIYIFLNNKYRLEKIVIWLGVQKRNTGNVLVVHWGFSFEEQQRQMAIFFKQSVLNSQAITYLYHEVISLDIYTILGFLTGLCILFILCRIFIVPLKFMLKLLANSLIGAIILLIVNFAGSYFGFHIGLNFITILFVSILGVPGAILLVIIQLLL